jgi:hypothetical protein
MIIYSDIIQISTSELQLFQRKYCLDLELLSFMKTREMGLLRRGGMLGFLLRVPGI